MRDSVFRGLRVFTADPFENGENSPPTQLLQRSTQVGEFYRMRAPVAYSAREGLPLHYMDIFIYDEKCDRLQLITCEEAMKYALPLRRDEQVKYNDGKVAEMKRAEGCSVFQGCDGTSGSRKHAYDAGVAGSKDPLALKDNLDPLDQKRIGNSIPADNAIMNERFIRANMSAVDKDGNDIADGATLAKKIKDMFVDGKTFNYSWNCFQLVVAATKVGIWMPLQITISRPFIEHSMYSAIAAVAGKATGATLFGHADMQISSNTSVKTIEGHYTCHFKSVVTRSENIYVMRDIMSTQYIAGADTRFFGTNTLEGEATKDVVYASDVKKQVRNRLRFEQEYADAYESMFAFLSPYNANQQYMQDGAFSMVGGSGLPWDIGTGRQMTDGHGSRLDCNFPGGLNFFTMYDNELQLSSIHHGEDMNQRQNQDYIRLGSYNNSVVILGPHRVKSPHASTGEFELVPGQGHWGPDALPGDARWRRGEAASLMDARQQLVGVDVLTNKKLPVTTYA